MEHTDSSTRQSEAASHVETGNALGASGQFRLADEAFLIAYMNFLSLSEEQPEDFEIKMRLLDVLRKRRQVLYGAYRMEQYLSTLLRSLALTQSFLAEWPDSADWHWYAARLQFVRWRVSLMLGDIDAAADAVTVGLTSLEHVSLLDPERYGLDASVKSFEQSAEVFKVPSWMLRTFAAFSRSTVFALNASGWRSKQRYSSFAARKLP